MNGKKSFIQISMVTMLLLSSFSILVNPVPAGPPPQPPHQFYGTVKDTAGQNISEGLTIKAIIVDYRDQSQNINSTIIYDGWYGYPIDNATRQLLVYSENAEDNKDSIYFFIENINTTQSKKWRWGGLTRLDLTIDDVPRFLSNSSDTSGTTGDSFAVNVTIQEYVDSGEELTVRVNWSHGDLCNNQTMSYTGGNTTHGFHFNTSFNLDSDSISDLTYVFYVNDTSDNHNSSGPHTVEEILDNDAPGFSDIGDTSPITGDPYNFTVNVTDNIDVSHVFLNYYFSGNWNNVTMSYSSVTDKYYRVLSVPSSATLLYYNVSANDTSNNWNETSSDTLSVTDDIDPVLVEDTSAASGTTGDSFVFFVNTSDNVDVASVNVSWSHGGLGGNKALSESPANNWSGSILLDDSLSDMYYFVQVNDSNGNNVSGGQQSVDVSDDDDPVLVSDNSPSTGNASDSYTFNISASDNIGVASANVSWSHGSLTGNENLSLTGSYWLATITLDSSSGNLVYTIQVNDTSGNSNVSSSNTVSVEQPMIVYVDDNQEASWYDETHVRTIQEGINNVTAGGTVYVWDGTYTENLLIDTSITLNANTSVILDGQGNNGINITVDNVTILNITIRNCIRTFPEYAMGIYVYNSSKPSDIRNINLTSITVDNCSIGIALDNATNCNIAGGNIENSSVGGIALGLTEWFSQSVNTSHCSFINISTCVISQNQRVQSGPGIKITNSTYCTISNNTIYNMSYNAAGPYANGIDLSYSDFNTIIDNNVSSCDSGGISLAPPSDNNTISSNEFYSNNNSDLAESSWGILLQGSSDNTIIENNISHSEYGFILTTFYGICSENNTVFHNNVYSNAQNSYDNCSNNNWYSINILHGNYWDDYTGSDSDADGVGETPYDIPGGSNQDVYPLVNKRTSPPSFVWVDGSYTSSTSGWNVDHFDTIQGGIDAVSSNGTVFVYNGTYYENLLIDKSITIDADSSAVLDGSSGYGMNITANNTTVQNISIMNCSYGIHVYNASFILHTLTLEHLNVTTCTFGIAVDNARYCNISYCTFSNPVHSGITFGLSDLAPSISSHCRYCNISHNTIKDSAYNGVYLINSSYTTIYNNTIYNNAQWGIEFENSNTSNIISSNTIYNNSDRGIHFGYSNHNTITLNTIYNNTNEGINLWISSNNTVFKNTIYNNANGTTISSSENNTLYHNNFYNNTHYNATDWSDNNNTWYNTTLEEGNYWGDYNGTDATGDGIGDTPYTNITGGSNNNDTYPLMYTYGNYYILSLTLSSSSVAEGSSFTATVKTQGGTTIQGATVSIQGDSGTTNPAGQVTLTAPSVSSDTTKTVTATKTGYTSASGSITVTNEGGGGNGGNGGNGGLSGDTTVPSTPSTVQCTSDPSDTTPVFTWEAATDNVAISGYYVKLNDGDDTAIGDVLTYEWPTVLADGTYTFSVKAKDTSGNYGDYGTCDFIIDTTGVLNPPLADPGGPYTGLTYQNITFDATGSSDPDGRIENYTWDLGDETHAYGVQVIHQYNTSGLFNITLTVTDDEGLTNTSTTTANITLDTDADGWSDELEEAYGTDKNNSADGPEDSDNDGIPDDESPDKKYTGDPDDDNDGVPDEIETELGSNTKDATDTTPITYQNKPYYVIDTDNDGTPDALYNPELGITTIIEQKDNQLYVDLDNDGTHDVIYDPAAGTFTEILEEPDEGLPLWTIIIVVVVLIILIIIGVLFKTGYLYFEEETIEEPPAKPSKPQKPKKKK